MGTYANARFIKFVNTLMPSRFIIIIIKIS